MSGLGYTPVILTVDEKLASYAINDPSLEKEIPSEVQVYKTKTKELFNLYLKITGKKNVPFSGFVHEGKAGFKDKLIRFARTHLFVPDPRKGWNRFAIKKAIEIIQKEKISHIVTTSPPHSTQLIGLKLKEKIPSLTWLADFRDPWTGIFYFDQLNHTFLSRKWHNEMEGKVLRKADSVSVVGPFMKKDFLDKHSRSVPENKIHIIPNGFDEEDFSGSKPRPENDFTITYTGTLAGNYRIDAFIQAVSEINRTLKKKIRLRFIGEICEEYQRKLREQFNQELYEIIPPVPHKQAIEYLFRSHILLLVIPDAPGNKAIVTGKLFEYLAAQKPILGIGPVGGDAASILHDTRAGKMIGYDNSELIKVEILRVYDQFTNNPSIKLVNNIEFFSRRMLTSKLLSILNER